MCDNISQPAMDMPDPTPPERLRPNWFHVLAALADRDIHGSEIARDVLDQTGGTLKLWPATLYRTLDDMVAAGLILELTGADHPEGASAKRRYYRLTPSGRTALEAAAAQMATWATIARQRLQDV